MQVLVLGVGNILLQDEGVGVRVVTELQHRYLPSDEVELLDGGTAGMSLIEDILDKEHVIIIDAVRTGAPVGTLVRLVGDEVPVFLQNRISPHQLGLSDILATLTIAGQPPPNLVLIGMVPRTIELGLELSPEIEAQVDALVGQVVRELADIGVRLIARSEVER